jgi:tetratricopeptide (TPR) repeat protein
MQRYFKILLLIFLPLMIHAQQKNSPDSIRQTLRMATTDSAKYSTTFKLFIYYQFDNTDSAFKYINECLVIARKNNYKINEADCLQNKALELSRLGKYAEAFDSFQEAFKIAEDPANEKNMALKNDNKYSFHQNRLDVLGWSHFNFGVNGVFTNSTGQEMFQYRKALQFGEEAGDKVLAGQATSAIASVYQSLNKLDSALTLYQEADQLILLGNGPEKFISDNWLSEGGIYESRGDKSKQLYYYRKGLEALTGHNELTKSGCYTCLANYFLQEKQGDSSLYYAKKNVEALKSAKANDIGWAYLTLSKSYKLRNEIDSAYKYQDLALAGIDSTDQAEIKNQSAFQKQSFKDQMRVKDLEQEKASYQSKIRTNILLGRCFYAFSNSVFFI